jgi:hypothetical protein
MFQNAFDWMCRWTRTSRHVNGTAVAGTNTVSGRANPADHCRAERALGTVFTVAGVNAVNPYVRTSGSHQFVSPPCCRVGHLGRHLPAIVRPRRLPDRDRFTCQRRAITILGAASAAYDSM